jgi:prolipoprotein diacylglyceryltransferase
MNKRRLIFLSVFGFYHLSALVFTLFVESKKEDFSQLLNLFGKITLFKYGALIGLLLFIAEVIWSWLDSKKLEKEKEAMRHENNVLKAKVYDLTQASKKV